MRKNKFLSCIRYSWEWMENKWMNEWLQPMRPEYHGSSNNNNNIINNMNNMTKQVQTSFMSEVVLWKNWVERETQTGRKTEILISLVHSDRLSWIIQSNQTNASKEISPINHIAFSAASTLRYFAEVTKTTTFVICNIIQIPLLPTD